MKKIILLLVFVAFSIWAVFEPFFKSLFYKRVDSTDWNPEIQLSKLFSIAKEPNSSSTDLEHVLNFFIDMNIDKFTLLEKEFGLSFYNNWFRGFAYRTRDWIARVPQTDKKKMLIQNALTVNPEIIKKIL